MLEASHKDLVQSIEILNQSLEAVAQDTATKIESLNTLVTEQFKVVKTMVMGKLDGISEELADIKSNGFRFDRNSRFWLGTVLISIFCSIGVYLFFH